MESQLASDVRASDFLELYKKSFVLCFAGSIFVIRRMAQLLGSPLRHFDQCCCISLGQRFAFRGSTGVPRQCLGVPSWLEQKYNKLGKSEPGLRAFATPANFFFSSLSWLTLASITADFVIVRVVLADPATFLVPFFGAILMSERSAYRPNLPRTRVVKGEI